MKSKLTGLLLILTHILVAQHTITINDIWEKGTFMPDYVWGMRSLKDGEHYSKMDYDYLNHSLSILAYRYKDGTLSDTLFSDQWIDEPLNISAYIMSPDESKIILASDEEAIYRYSRKANYYIFDRQTKQIKSLYEKGKQKYPDFSPDGSKVAFVYNRNLYYRDLNNNQLIQITFNGLGGQLLNAEADWVYEEELELTQAYQWSPDGKNIAFLRFNISAEPMFIMSVYNDSLYPNIKLIPYPKAGKENAKVSLWDFNLTNQISKQIDTDPGEE